MNIHHFTKWLFSMNPLLSFINNGVGTSECSYSRMVTRSTNHCNRDLHQITLFGLQVIWTGSKNTEILLIKIYTLNFNLLRVIVVFAIIYMDRCFCSSSAYHFDYSDWQLAHVVYICLFRLLIVSTHLGITWPNDIVWLTLTIFFSARWHCKKEIKSTSDSKSDKDSPGFK